MKYIVTLFFEQEYTVEADNPEQACEIGMALQGVEGTFKEVTLPSPVLDDVFSRPKED